jgi:hypothetical protein
MDTSTSQFTLRAQADRVEKAIPGWLSAAMHNGLESLEAIAPSRSLSRLPDLHQATTQRPISKHYPMKTNLKNPFLRATLIAGLTFAWAGRVAAQDDAVLYSFPVVGTNSPNYGGSWPTTGLVLSSNVLYGLTAAGGSARGGTVFSLSTNGTAFSDRYDFTTDPSRADGKYTKNGLILAGDTLYGTIYYGGSASNGVVFAVRTNGTGYTKLHEFDGADGKYPSGNLALFNDTPASPRKNRNLRNAAMSSAAEGSTTTMIR